MSPWTRSSLCVTGDCLEAMRTGPVVLVQDSKIPGRRQEWELWEWQGLLVAVADYGPLADGTAGNYAHRGIYPRPSFGYVVLGLRRHESLWFSYAEWNAFVAGVLAGEFDFDNLSTPDPAPPLEGGTGADEVTAASDSAVTATVGEGVSGEASSSTVLDAPAGRSSLAPWGGAETGQPGSPIYGDVVIRKVEPQYIVEHAPPRTLMSLSLLQASDDRALFIAGGDVVFIGYGSDSYEVSYQVTGWDAEHRGLILERRSPAADDDALARAAAPLTQHVPDSSPNAPARGEFCHRHFSWLCQAGQGKCSESHLSSATGDVVAATGAAVAVTGGEAGPVTRTPGPAEPEGNWDCLMRTHIGPCGSNCVCYARGASS